MPIRRYKPEQIVTILQIEVSIANGKTSPRKPAWAGAYGGKAGVIPNK
jgi:hypothetical protein